MKMIKSLILGSAAGLVAMSGAQAADLPVKAKAVEYVKVCSLYGAGFYYIPGTDTCIKIGGYLRAEVVINSNNSYSGSVSAQDGAQNRYTNGYTWRSREDLTIDTRTATEYGVVRTFWDATFSWTTDNYSGNGTNGTVYSPNGPTPFAASTNNAGAGNIAAGNYGMYYAYIQFAGFTMGKAISQFSAPWTNYPGNNFDGLVGGGGTVTGVNQFSYTAQFGNGVSGTISAQDQVQYYQAGVNNLSTGPYGVSDYAGTITPDLVAMLRVDQAWGLFQASFAAHDNHAGYYLLGTETSGHPNDVWGFAGQLALSIKNIPTGVGDTINLQAVYTDGATRYNIQDLSRVGAATIYGGTNAPGAYQSLTLGFAPDTVFANGGSQQKIQTWGFRGGFTHNWDPMWNTSVYGAYAAVRYNDTSKALICGVGGVGGTFRATFGAGVVNCDPDYQIAQAGIITRWTPVKNLTFSADVTYQFIDQKHTGLAVTSSAAIGKPVAAYELRDQGTVTALLRAQRNW